MVLIRKGMLGVLALACLACGDDGADTGEAEPTAASALVAQPDVALVENGDDLSAQWSGWGSRSSAEPSGGWDASSVANWCFLLDDRAAFLCKVTFADCERPRDTFTKILCELKGFIGGNSAPTPPKDGAKPPSGDAWGDVVDVDGDDDKGGNTGKDDGDSWDDSDDDSEESGLGG